MTIEVSKALIGEVVIDHFAYLESKKALKSPKFPSGYLRRHQIIAAEARMDKKLIKIPEVAKRLNVSEARARELARTKLIPSVRVGRQLRFDPDAIDTWIRRGGKALPGGWRRDPADK